MQRRRSLKKQLYSPEDVYKRQEEEQYQGLIELGKKKREVVIRADIKTLDEITATEQEAASNLQNPVSYTHLIKENIREKSKKSRFQDLK